MARCFPESGHPGVHGLHDYQAEALHRLRMIMQLRRGAVLADSVGLGKTHVAAALARIEHADGHSILVSAPAHLREHWSRHMRGIDWAWQSHTSLSRRSSRGQDATLIIVDEAHAFRNPRTRRYASLAIRCSHARVLLLTATPVNNSLLDFFHLVRLFAGRGDFADIGVPDLDAAVRSALESASTSALRRIADAVVVRRTRRAVQTDFGSRPAFPTLGPIERVRYGRDRGRSVLVQQVLKDVPRLEFPAHATAAGVPELLRLGLLKRLESSTCALSASVRRHMRILEAFHSAASAGRLFDPRRDAVGLSAVDGAVQLTLHDLTLPGWPAGVDRTLAMAAADRDLARLQRIAAAAAGASEAADAKARHLLALMHDLPRQDRIVIFTEYRETAVALWRDLLHTERVGLVHGSGAALGRGRASRRQVVERFAPGKHARQPPRTEDVRILIATDVLAEGMNLQAARVVICYDLPWNPIRIAQRIGRIDRLGSPHTRIDAYAFLPDPHLDDVLGLMRRIRRKLKAVRIVGGDAPWSIAGSRRAAALLGELDETCEARARARLLWRQMSDAAEPAGEGPPVFGIAPWDDALDAALVCFRLGRTHVLVLQRADGTSEIDNAACWEALAAAARSTDDSLDNSLVDDARRAARRARATLRRAGTPTTSAALDRTGLTSVTIMLRRLARSDVPGDAAAIDAAESAMMRLSVGGPAGTIGRPRNERSPAARVVAVVVLRARRPATGTASAL